MKSKATYTKITAKIIFTILFFAIATSFIYGEYMKKDAIKKLAYIDAKKTSMLVFESLYSAMQRGWSKDDISEIIKRLNKVDSSMEVNVYRSEVVASIYGEIQKDKETRVNNKEVARAMLGEELLNISEVDFIEYLYPVKAKNECLKCHTNAKVDDVLGVIDIAYPIENLKVSLTELINFFIIFMVVFSIVIFIAIFFELNKYLIKPIQTFSSVIKSITRSNDMTQRVLVDDDIEELDDIKSIFNNMLDSIEHQFYNDTLTGLENRRRLTEELEKRKNVFLMIINIDSFQEINDLYGDQAGDAILKEFALFLQKNRQENVNLYRLHSDEFAHLCSLDKDIEEFKIFASLVNKSISEKKFKINEKTEVSLTATMGISYGSEMLLINADTALKLAKKEKKDFLFYDDSMAMAKEYEKNLEWTKRLKYAIENEKILPVFQPIVDVKTRKIIKYESLMRMQAADGSLIAPVHFLELSKKNKLYHQLTKIMIEKVFDRFKDLDTSVSINLSVDDILNKDIHKFIIKKLESSSISKNIIFEIIESEGIENFEQVLEFINSVKRYGVKISIDDFGTGYSNFEYLMKLKVDYIKIDGSMIKNIDNDKNSQMVTQTIVEFAKKMKIKTVAEFVHSKDVYDKIAELGVNSAQGYYFGAPSTKID
ncbi:EAL domain-containing protein [Sulfurimonas sp.]